MTANLVTQEMLEQDLLKSGEPVLVDFFHNLVRPVQGHGASVGRGCQGARGQGQGS